MTLPRELRVGVQSFEDCRITFQQIASILQEQLGSNEESLGVGERHVTLIGQQPDQQAVTAAAAIPDGELVDGDGGIRGIKGSGLLSSDVAAALPLFNGAIEEMIDIAVTSNGTTITLSLQQSGGGDLHVFFAGTRVAYDTSPADTISLLEGTDVLPKLNYVFLTESGGVVSLNVNDTGFPVTANAPIAKVFCQSAASMETDGPFVEHAWTDHINSTMDKGHLGHLNERLRLDNAPWRSGVAPADLASNLYLSTSAGVVSQIHTHTMPARDMATGDPAWVTNEPGSAYNRITALSSLTQDAEGTSLSNRYFNIILWGVVSEEEAHCKLYINLPTGVYVVEADAQKDVNGTANSMLPAETIGSGFLIARYTLRLSGGTLTQSQKLNLRGSLPSTSPGGGVTTDDLYKLDGSRPLTGDMDVNGNAIVSVSDGDIEVIPDGTGVFRAIWSGKEVGRIVSAQPPDNTGGDVATADNYSGGSTPIAIHRGFAFSGAQSEYMRWRAWLFYDYDNSTNIRVEIPWVAVTHAASPNDGIRLDVTLAPIAYGSDDFDGDLFSGSTAVSVTDLSVTQGVPELATVSISRSNAGSPSAGDGLFLMVFRDHDHAGDTLSGSDALVLPDIRLVYA